MSESRRSVQLNFDGGITKNPGGQMKIGWQVMDVQTGAVLAEDGGPVDSGDWPEPAHRTNNVAEFLGVLGGLKWLTDQCVDRLQSVRVVGDSQFVVKCIDKRSGTSKPHLKPLMEECRRRIEALRSARVKVTIVWVRREDNRNADALTRRPNPSGEGQVTDRAGAVQQQSDEPLTPEFVVATLPPAEGRTSARYDGRFGRVSWIRHRGGSPFDLWVCDTVVNWKTTTRTEFLAILSALGISRPT